MMVKWPNMWSTLHKFTRWLLLFGACPFPLAQNNTLASKLESQKWDTEPYWKTIMITHASFTLWCVLSWSVKLSGEGKENHYSAGLQPAPTAKTNLGWRKSLLLGMKKNLFLISLFEWQQHTNNWKPLWTFACQPGKLERKAKASEVAHWFGVKNYA